MKLCSIRAMCVAVAISSVAPGAGARVTFSLDFSHDDGGLFDARSADGRAAQAAVQRAALTFSDRLLDRLTSIAPGGGNTWSPRIIDPGTGLDSAAPLTSLPEGAIKVYVGSRPLGVTEVANAAAGYGSAGGTTAFTNNVASRGQSGALASPRTDYGPWGGSIAFDIDTNWHFGLTPGTLTANKMDMVSVATHELAHLLGFSTGQPSYAALVNANGRFTGPRATASNGGTPPAVNASHWANVTGTVGPGGPTQLAVMNPNLPTGARRRVTLTDWAALDDLGWDLALPGDANADGEVNFPDLQALELNYGLANARWSQGDFNEDGLVNRMDYGILFQNYGRRFDGTSAAALTPAELEAAITSAPEPGVGVLVAGAVAMAMGRRRR